MQLASRKPADVAPPRMNALAKLPLFLDLAGKRVVVAGGSAMAAWKAELTAAAGASVEVYAAELSAEMAHLIEHGAAAGSFTHYARAWSPTDLPGATLALADALDEAEARTFWDAARSAGVVVNVIDKPKYCQFQMGTIVNRSPVVVAISTDGGSPILGQAIRRRIETLLPPTLGVWGAMAKRLRSSVSARLPFGARRRAFWETFAERALTQAPTPAAENVAAHLIASIADAAPEATGRVTLVGAGPGDAELLTLKAVRAMQAADVILFDDLVSADVLELARREAKRMAVGKRGRRESCSQADINALMVKLALQGKHVVRLKSGDPMIFGRAGEEIAVLEAAGIQVTVVPGITAGLALGSALGVSLTHREHAQSVRFITGHTRHGELPGDMDWQGLADPRTTLLFYMAGRTAPAIADKLIAAGLSPATPVVIGTGLSRSAEKLWHGTLSCVADDFSPGADQQPVLIGIGRTFASAKIARVPDEVVPEAQILARDRSTISAHPTSQTGPTPAPACPDKSRIVGVSPLRGFSGSHA